MTEERLHEIEAYYLGYHSRNTAAAAAVHELIAEVRRLQDRERILSEKLSDKCDDLREMQKELNAVREMDFRDPLGHPLGNCRDFLDLENQALGRCCLNCQTRLDEHQSYRCYDCHRLFCLPCIKSHCHENCAPYISFSEGWMQCGRCGEQKHVGSNGTAELIAEDMRAFIHVHRKCERAEEAERV